MPKVSAQWYRVQPDAFYPCDDLAWRGAVGLGSGDTYFYTDCFGTSGHSFPGPPPGTGTFPPAFPFTPNTPGIGGTLALQQDGVGTAASSTGLYTLGEFSYKPVRGTLIWDYQGRPIQIPNLVQPGQVPSSTLRSSTYEPAMAAIFEDLPSAMNPHIPMRLQDRNITMFKGGVYVNDIPWPLSPPAPPHGLYIELLNQEIVSSGYVSVDTPGASASFSADISLYFIDLSGGTPVFTEIMTVGTIAGSGTGASFGGLSTTLAVPSTPIFVRMDTLPSSWTIAYGVKACSSTVPSWPFAHPDSGGGRANFWFIQANHVGLGTDNDSIIRGVFDTGVTPSAMPQYYEY